MTISGIADKYMRKFYKDMYLLKEFAQTESLQISSKRIVEEFSSSS